MQSCQHPHLLALSSLFVPVKTKNVKTICFSHIIPRLASQVELLSKFKAFETLLSTELLDQQITN